MHYLIDSEVVWTPSLDEVRIYSARSGEFRTLNHTAAEIWLELAENRSVPDVVAELARRHGAESPAQRALIAKDVQEFVARLLAQDLLVAADQGDARV
ncbi:PqqD family protein [Kitasatospora sp. NPDC057940]|uniref:PqqD family protein n=1 Tax=unclassified Kitasatospora TaxID=2633591 RepID=UPI002F911C9A|nr:PqqD family protein [Kitasatospora sp. NBC_01300]